MRISDWSSDVCSSDLNLSIIGTLDGQTVFIQEEPKLTLFKKAARYYACSVPGVWHILDMSATEVGQAIHLRDFELTASYAGRVGRSEEHTSELQSLMRSSYAVSCLKKKTYKQHKNSKNAMT